MYGGKMSEKPYKLVPEKIPPLPRGVRFSMYDMIINEFLESKESSVRVEYPNKSAVAVASGLRSRIRKRKLKNVRVSMKAGKVYLVKVE